jgi:hypothetical protein
MEMSSNDYDAIMGVMKVLTIHPQGMKGRSIDRRK